MATPCAVRYSRKPKARYAISSKLSPSTAVTTPAAASSNAITARLDSRRVAGGTTSAAQP